MDFKRISNCILITNAVISALKKNLWRGKDLVQTQKANKP